MPEMKLQALAPIEWDDSLVVVAFPTTGSVASIAGHYLQQKLELPLVGSFIGQPPAPVAAVRDGVATSPLRVFGGEVQCKLPQGSCPRLYLLLSDLPLNAAAFVDVSRAILDVASGANLVLCLDAVPRDEGDDTPDVYGVATDPSVLPDLVLEGVTPMKEAFLGGMTGQLLLSSHGTEARVGALVVEALKDLPDGRAAANLLQAVDQLLPLVPVDHAPLLAEALELEKEVRKAQEAAERQQPDPGPRMDTYI